MSTCAYMYIYVGLLAQINLLHLCQLLVCSGKFQLSNYPNGTVQISIDLAYVISCQDYFMS